MTASSVAGQIESIERVFAHPAAGKHNAPALQEIVPDGNPAPKLQIEAIIIGAFVVFSFLNAAFILYH